MSEVVVVASSTLDTAGAIARRLTARGATVAVLVPTAQQLPEVVVIPCELSNPNEVLGAAHRVERELGPIARWINAGMSDLRYVNATRAALDCMQHRNRGSVVQVSAPHTVRIYTDALRTELRLAGSGIHLDNLRTLPFRRIGATLVGTASIAGAILLRRAFHAH